MMIKTPNYNTFAQFLYDNGVIDWDPQEHENWELPPSKCLEWFWMLFPLDEDAEVVDYITFASKRRIQKYFFC